MGLGSVLVVGVRSGGDLEAEGGGGAQTGVAAARGDVRGGCGRGRGAQDRFDLVEEAGPRTTRARVCRRTASVRVSRWSNCSVTTTVTLTARPCRRGISRRDCGSRRPSAAARWVSTLGRSRRSQRGRRMSSGAGWPACRARFVAISRRSVSWDAHSRLARAPERPHSTARTPSRPVRQACSPLPPPSTMTTSPCWRARRAIERSKVVVPLPGSPTASRCGSVERTPVRQMTGGTSRCSSPEGTRSSPEDREGALDLARVGEAEDRLARCRHEALGGDVGAERGRTATVSSLPSSSQVKRYSRPRPALACSSCSMRARASASPSVKYAG